MKKYLSLIVCFIAVMNMGCSTGVTVPAASSPEAFDAVMAPIGGGSTANDWRNVTDGYWMYYFDYSESRLYRVNPALENAEMIYDGGYSWISLDGSDVRFWDWMDQLHHVSADGTEQVVLESERDISASWFYEGSLYYLESPDCDVSLIKRLDLKTMEVTDLDRMINGTSPALLVSAGHIFFTEMMSEIDESYDLYRLDLDGTNEVLISDHAGIVQLFEDKLCYPQTYRQSLRELREQANKGRAQGVSTLFVSFTPISKIPMAEGNTVALHRTQARAMREGHNAPRI